MKSRASLAALAFCACCANPAFSEGGGASATATPRFAFVDEEVSLRVAGAEGPVAAAVSVVTPDGVGPRRAGLLAFRGGVALIRPLAEGIHAVRLDRASPGARDLRRRIPERSVYIKNQRIHNPSPFLCLSFRMVKTHGCQVPIKIL